MSYKFISQINESAAKVAEYNALVESTIDVFEFDRAKVIHDAADVEAFLESIKDRPLLEACDNCGYEENEESAAQARAGEREWMASAARDAEISRREGRQVNRRLGLAGDSRQAPERGQKVILPGNSGIATIIQTEIEDELAMLGDSKGRQFVVSFSELSNPRRVGKSVAWMLAKK